MQVSILAYTDVYSKTNNLLLKLLGGSKNILEAVNLKLKQTSILEKSCSKCSCVFTDFNRSYVWALPSVEVDLADFWSWGKNELVSLLERFWAVYLVYLEFLNLLIWKYHPSPYPTGIILQRLRWEHNVLTLMKVILKICGKTFYSRQV